MNRHEFEKAVYESTLDRYSKQILAYYAYRKHWNKDGKCWPSAEDIASGTGIGHATVERRIPLLRAHGWLIDTGEVAHNGKGRPSIKYDLGVGTTFPITVRDKAEVLAPQSEGEVTDLSPQSEAPLPSETGPFPSESRDFTLTVRDEVSKEQVKEEVREEVRESPSPSGPVDITSSNNTVKESQVNRLLLLNTGARQVLERVAGVYDATQDQLQEAAYLLTTNSVRGGSWYEQCVTALKKVGVKIEGDDEW